MSNREIEADFPRRLIDAKETAALLGCGVRTLYSLADRGRVPFGHKLGALRRWDSAELQAFIAGGCVMPTKRGKGATRCGRD